MHTRRKAPKKPLNLAENIYALCDLENQMGQMEASGLSRRARLYRRLHQMRERKLRTLLEMA